VIGDERPAALIRVAHRIVPVFIDERPGEPPSWSVYNWGVRSPGQAWICGPGAGVPKTLAETVAYLEQLLRGGFAHNRFLIVLRGAA